MSPDGRLTKPADIVRMAACHVWPWNSTLWKGSGPIFPHSGVNMPLLMPSVLRSFRGLHSGLQYPLSL